MNSPWVRRGHTIPAAAGTGQRRTEPCCRVRAAIRIFPWVRSSQELSFPGASMVSQVKVVAILMIVHGSLISLAGLVGGLGVLSSGGVAEASGVGAGGGPPGHIREGSAPRGSSRRRGRGPSSASGAPPDDDDHYRR